MNINEHKLDGVKFIPTKNRGKNIAPGLMNTVIIHYTASADTDATVSWLCNPAAQASAHLVVGRGGEVVQLVPFNAVSWHAGISEFTFPDGTTKKNFNNFSIGIEIVNCGILQKSGSKYVSWFGKEYGDDDVIFAVHRNRKKGAYWQRYTQAQIEKVEEICFALKDAYNIQNILGHEEIAPERKVDPGPAFPLDKLRGRVLQTDPRSGTEEADEVPPVMGTVIAKYLNIRDQPGGEIIAPPLCQYTPVKIVQESEDWYKVKVEISGWVSSDYVNTKNHV